MSEQPTNEPEVMAPEREAPAIIVTQSQAPARARRSITEAMANKYGMERDAFERLVRQTCFPSKIEVSREEFAACMLIANKLELNPVTKEIHFARAKTGGIQALIGVDGWFVMANRHPQYDGCEFVKRYDDVWQEFEEADEQGLPTGKFARRLVKTCVGITCKIFRKDRSHPTEIEELMVECRRASEAWKLTPERMLRHRAFGQCARLAFSFVGLMDDDEFARWQESGEAPGVVPHTALTQNQPSLSFDIFASPAPLPGGGETPPPVEDTPAASSLDTGDATQAGEEGTVVDERIAGWLKALSEAIEWEVVSKVQSDVAAVIETISDDDRWVLVEAIEEAKQRVNS
jgi:phage recombination protein Bet